MASPADRAQALEILRRPRPEADPAAVMAARVHQALAAVSIGADARAQIAAAIGPAPQVKRDEDVSFLLRLIDQTGAARFARATAAAEADRAAAALTGLTPALRPGPHADFLRAVIAFVVERTR
jgi:hypothetical protein